MAYLTAVDFDPFKESPVLAEPVATEPVSEPAPKGSLTPVDFNPFGQARSEPAPSLTPVDHDPFKEAPATNNGKSFKDHAGDMLASVVSGAVLFPEAVVGLFDLIQTPQRMAFEKISGLDVRTLTQELAGDGVDFKKTREILGEMKSSESKAQRDEVNKAFSDGGILDGFSSLGDNPSVVMESVVESAPQMLSLAAGTQFVALKIFSNAAKSATATGASAEAARVAGQKAVDASMPYLAKISVSLEGAQAAGNQAAEYSSEGNLGIREALASVGAGVSTATIGRLSNKVGSKIGLEDIEASLGTAGLRKGSGNLVKDIAKGAAKGAIKEGPLEEAPQSAGEQLFQNVGDRKALTEGIGQAAVEGGAAGVVMGVAGGGGASLRSGSQDSTGLNDDAGPQQKVAEFKQELELIRQEVDQMVADGATPEDIQPFAEAAELIQAEYDAFRQENEQAIVEAPIEAPVEAPVIEQPQVLPEGEATAQELGVAFPDAQPVEATPRSPGEIPVSPSSGNMDGLDGLVIAAERMEFHDEAARLRNAKRLFGAYEKATAEGDTTSAKRYLETASKIYEDVTGEASALAELKEHFPVPYVAEGEITGGELTVDNRPNFEFSQRKEDIPGQSFDGGTVLAEPEGFNERPIIVDKEGQAGRATQQQLDDAAGSQKSWAALEQEYTASKQRVADGVETDLKTVSTALSELRKVDIKAPVDAGRDELQTIIAKLGGINKNAAKQQGFDPEMLNERVASRNPWRVNGQTFDEMAENLSQYGFFSDRDYTQNELIDMMQESVSGTPVYAPGGYEHMQEMAALSDREDTLSQQELLISETIGGLTDNERIFHAELIRRFAKWRKQARRTGCN